MACGRFCCNSVLYRCSKTKHRTAHYGVSQSGSKSSTPTLSPPWGDTVFLPDTSPVRQGPSSDAVDVTKVVVDVKSPLGASHHMLGVVAGVASSGPARRSSLDLPTHRPLTEEPFHHPSERPPTAAAPARPKPV